MKIPQPIDELMWLVAEQRDASAMEAFGIRYPEYRSEMLRRAESLTSLKESRPISPAKAPPFRLQPIPTRPRWISTGIPIAAAMACFAVGASLWTRHSVVHKPAIKVEDSPITIAPFKSTSGHHTVKVEPRPEPDQAPTEQAETITAELEPLERPITIRENKTTVKDVLNKIQDRAGIAMTISPGLADSEVQVDYVDRPVMDVLQDLGQTMGFTVFREGDNEVLIVPGLASQEPASGDMPVFQR